VIAAVSSGPLDLLVYVLVGVLLVLLAFYLIRRL
jgi:hypothetical protein